MTVTIKIKPSSMGLRELYQRQAELGDLDLIELYAEGGKVINAKEISKRVSLKVSVQAVSETGERTFLSAFFVWPHHTLGATPLRFSAAPLFFDNRFEDDIVVRMDNLSKSPYTIKPFQKIGSLMIRGGGVLNLEVVDKFDE